MNSYWDDIREHYRKSAPAILRCASHKWAIDPYAWNGIVAFTPIEQALWSDMRAVNAVFYPQYPIAKFFVDFANPVAKVIVECDGKAFHLDKDKDAARDAILKKIGWSVYRIPGSTCMTDPNQETGEASAARRFIDVICEKHWIQSKEKRKTVFTIGELVSGYAGNLLDKYPA